MKLPPCRLFLVTPRGGAAEEIARVLEAGLRAGDVASVLLTQQASGQDTRNLSRALRPVAHAHDVALIIEEDAALAAETMADGVELQGGAEAIAAARRKIGPDRVVGAQCLSGRHQAMECGEAGAEYVVLDQDSLIGEDGESLVAWWASVFEVPCVAARPVELEGIAVVAKQGADFVRPAAEIWRTPETAAAFVAEANRILKEVAI